MTNKNRKWDAGDSRLGFVLRHSFVIRPSSFVIILGTDTEACANH
jgi:hypothetical protein